MANILDLITNGEKKILVVDADPSAGAGTPAEVGSIAQFEAAGPLGQLWLKIGAADTAWDRIPTLTGGGNVAQGVFRRLAIYATSPNGYLVDDTINLNSQQIDVIIVDQATRTVPITYTIPNPGDAVGAADFVLTEGVQTINGDKTFGDDVVIQGDLTVNGTLAYLATTNTTIEDALITLNKGGAAASGGGVGFEIEENSAITGFFKTTAARDGFELQAPDTNMFTLDMSALTADRAVTAQDRDGYMALQTDSALTQGSVTFVDSNLRLAQNNTNLFWDNSNNRLGIGNGSPQETLHVTGNARVSGSGANIRLLADSDMRISQATVSTTNATVTNLQTISIPTDSMVIIEARVSVRKTGGAGAGNVGDGAGYVRTARFKNIGGTVTMHTLQSDYTSEDAGMAGLNCVLDANSTNARVRVTGLANDNLTWECTTTVTVLD